MSLQQGPQSSAKGKEVAEEIVMTVRSKDGLQQFNLTAKDVDRQEKIRLKMKANPKWKDFFDENCAPEIVDTFYAYCFHQSNVCLAEAAQHKANAEQARQRKEEHLAKAAKLDKLIEKDEAIIAENKKRIEALSKKTDALRKEIENDKAQIAEAVFRIEDREKELVYAREQYVANLYQNRNLITAPKSVMSQNTPPSLQRHKVS